MNRFLVILMVIGMVGLVACSDENDNGDDEPKPNVNPGPVACENGIQDTPAESQPDTLCNAEYTGDLTLTASEDKAIDYHVPNSIRFTDGSSLTVEAGVVLEFQNNAQLTIREGSEVHMNGSEGSPIVLQGETETAGFWKTVAIYSGNVTNNMDYVTLQHAGSEALDGSLAPWKMGLYIDEEGRIKIRNCTFRENDGHGLAAYEGARLPEFQRNSFIENLQAPISVSHGVVQYLDTQSSFSNNGESYVEVDNELQNCCPPDELNGEHTWVFNQLPLRLTGILTSEGDQLTLEKGVHIQVEGDNKLYFNGSLIINGTANDSVRIDGVPDAQGAWAGIGLEKATSTFDWAYVSIGEGGSREVDEVFQDEPANVFVTADATLNIRNSSIYGSGGYGIAYDDGGGSSLNDSDMNYYANASGDTFAQP